MQTNNSQGSVSENSRAYYDAVIVGAGFAGLYMLYKLRERGLKAIVLEAADGIGGTWYNNRYPGARCDVESLDYSFSFSDEIQQTWCWSEKYAAQPEILAYTNFVADKLDLRKDILLNSNVNRVHFEEDTHTWDIGTEANDSFRSKYVVMACGVLSASQQPNINGIERFEGEIYHTAHWPKEKVDFQGSRVAVIGTGASGVQIIPLIAQEADHLTVLQRTANFCVPLRNEPLDPEFQNEWKKNYSHYRQAQRQAASGHNQEPNLRTFNEMTPQEREQELEKRWNLGGMYMLRAFADQMSNEKANRAVGDFVIKKTREVIADESVFEKLRPKDILFGTKRLCVGTNYYETFNRENVTLVDIQENPIQKITEQGIQTEDSFIALDKIVFATGFDAFTGPLMKMNIRGVHGMSLEDKWSEGPVTTYGLMTHGFPNLFFIANAGSPSVLSAVTTIIEINVEWIDQIIGVLEHSDVSRIDTTQIAEQHWGERANLEAQQLLYSKSPNSWYLGANIPGKPQVFMPYVGGAGKYNQIITEEAESGYPSFEFEGKGEA